MENMISLEGLSEHCQKQLKKILEQERKAKNIREVIRHAYPNALEVVFTIDEDRMNERIYYDFDCIKDRNSEVVLNDKAEDYELPDMIREFVWDYVSLNDTYGRQQFTINLDTLEYVTE